jgi:hypothetical protein
LVDAHIANFRERNFSDLGVAFGCTGGQHRSVYFAERLARHVREHHPDTAVGLTHGARARWTVPEGRPAATGGSAPAGGSRADSPGDESWTR